MESRADIKEINPVAKTINGPKYENYDGIHSKARLHPRDSLLRSDEGAGSAFLVWLLQREE
jgi:hypothetical protein